MRYASCRLNKEIPVDTLRFKTYTVYYVSCMHSYELYDTSPVGLRGACRYSAFQGISWILLLRSVLHRYRSQYMIRQLSVELREACRHSLYFKASDTTLYSGLLDGARQSHVPSKHVLGLSWLCFGCLLFSSRSTATICRSRSTVEITMPPRQYEGVPHHLTLLVQRCTTAVGTSRPDNTYVFPA